MAFPVSWALTEVRVKDEDGVSVNPERRPFIFRIGLASEVRLSRTR